jgi:hypothetical protein
VGIERTHIFIPGFGEADVRVFGDEGFGVFESMDGSEGWEDLAKRGVGADMVEFDAENGPVPEVIEEGEDAFPDFDEVVGIDEWFEVVGEPMAGGFEEGDGVESEGQDGDEIGAVFDGDEAEGSGGDEFVDDHRLPDGAREDGCGSVAGGEGGPAR